MNENNVDTIADYLNQKLGTKEQADFENEIQTNPTMKEDLEKLRLLRQIAERNRILEQAKTVHTQRIEALKKPKGGIISLAKIATLAAAASVIFMIYLGNSEVNYLEISSVERGDGNVKTALINFENGVNLLKDNKNQAAISEFENVLKNQDIEEYYRDASQWYEAVALTKIGEDEQAKRILNSIENNKNFKYQISFWDKIRIKIRLLM